MVTNDGWLDKKSIEIPIFQRTTFKVSSLVLPSVFQQRTNDCDQYALFIIGKCAFGLPFKWSDPPTASDGTLSLQEALHLTTNNFLTMLLTPNWAFKLPINRYAHFCPALFAHVDLNAPFHLTRLKTAKEAHDQLSGYMHEQVEKRRLEVREGTSRRNDVFTRLVEANEEEESKFRLADDELVSDIPQMRDNMLRARIDREHLRYALRGTWWVIFQPPSPDVLSGVLSETTAHTLAATLGFLAYYSDIQEEVHQHILSIIGDSRNPVSDVLVRSQTVVLISSLVMG